MSTTQERLERPLDQQHDVKVNGESNGRRRRILIPAAIIVVLIGVIFGIRYLVYAAHHVSTDDAQIGGDITTIAPRVKGQVTAVYVSENQFVHKGDRVLQLDNRDYLVAVAQAKAALAQTIASEQAAQEGVPLQSALTSAQTAQAEAGIVQATGQSAAAQARIDAAQQSVAAAQAQAAAAAAATTKAQRDVERAKSLVAEGAISRSQWDAAAAAYDTALANQHAAQDNVQVARAGVDQAMQDARIAQSAIAASDAGLQQAQTGTQSTSIKTSQAHTASAQVQAAQAALAAAQLQLSYTTITSPVDGVVSKKSVNVGDQVAASQPLMAVAATTDLWVTANLKETQITNVRVGQPASIKVDAFPGQTFTGHVKSLSPATGATFALIPPDNASGNFTKVVQRVPVRITIDPSSDPQHLLKQGLSVETSIDISNR